MIRIVGDKAIMKKHSDKKNKIIDSTYRKLSRTKSKDGSCRHLHDLYKKAFADGMRYYSALVCLDMKTLAEYEET